ncbi:MerR family transcriptional regulator [Luedemannella helvata]|uniref:MerR family transcriptional regulator n=2 Tax=Luedemannella helvata TaxID=349315 RepID=A0ABP4WFZ2_9ACTN
MTAEAAARGRPREQTATTGATAPVVATMSIGEVLSRLRPQFPDVTISKLRFLEAEGLIEPHRAPSGYRKYSVAHLDRLRFILSAQRDRYLPLRVIREQLAALDRGERVVGVSVAQPSDGPAADVSAGAVEVRVSRAELTERAGLDAESVTALIEYGLLVPGSDGSFDAEALAVARAAAQLAAYGIGARHLRASRAAADREVGLLEQIVTPIARHGGPGGRAQALETVHELAALTAQLHAALVRAGLRRGLGV